MRRILLLIALLPAVTACDSGDQSRVVGVSDGDTLTVLNARTQTRVRLHGIDAPETGQDYGARAKQLASELAFGKAVTVRPVEKDRYGRTVAEVILPDGGSLNREMVGQGMAWWDRQYAPHDVELATLETAARAARRGLWSQPGPIPPWEWRKGVRSEAEPKATGFVGNRNSFIYQSPRCPSVGRMSEKNKVAFDTAGEAEAAGYRRAKDCR